MRITHDQRLGHTWLIIVPYRSTIIIGLYLKNNSAPFPAQNVVVGQRK